MSFGFEMTDTHLNVYTHFMKVGKKVELLKKDPRVCIEFSIFNDFPDKKYKGHYHDYRSVIAKGKMIQKHGKKVIICFIHVMIVLLNH